MSDYESECHDTECDRSPKWLIHLTYLPGMGSMDRSVMRRCDEHFIPALHEKARMEYKHGRGMVRIRDVVKVAECPVEFCDERPPVEDLESHVEREHDVKTLSDRAYNRFKQIVEAIG